MPHPSNSDLGLDREQTYYTLKIIVQIHTQEGGTSRLDRILNRDTCEEDILRGLVHVD